MRTFSFAAIAALATLITGCSNSSATATASPAPAASAAYAVDSTTGLPIYPGSKVDPTFRSGDPEMLYLTTDDHKKIVAFYRSVLPASYELVPYGETTYFSTNHKASVDQVAIERDTAKWNKGKNDIFLMKPKQ